ncbi:MAG: hypothetical protein DRQ98_13625 [Gammaproteobacteria bacterium]|nr:MAG: hypothetical protein DRQ98_13625 [Gammaproteobacteria bacterium]
MVEQAAGRPGGGADWALCVFYDAQVAAMASVDVTGTGLIAFDLGRSGDWRAKNPALRAIEGGLCGGFGGVLTTEYKAAYPLVRDEQFSFGCGRFHAATRGLRFQRRWMTR